MLRAHGTIGHVSGPDHLRAELAAADRSRGGVLRRPDRRTTRSSRTCIGLEGVYGVTSRGGRFDFFAGSGVTWLRPRFEVGFTNLDGITDNTQVEVESHARGRCSAARRCNLPAFFALTAEVYSVPKDVTTWRLAASYRLH